MATIRPNTDGLSIGKAGKDTVYGDSRANVLFGAGGNDTLWARGNTDFLDGGAGNDKLYGEGGNDFLAGGRGRDTLTGGSGKDAFVFDAKLRSSEIDTITDFSVKNDSIWLDKQIFTKLGKSDTMLKAAAFWTGTAAHDASDRIIYNKESGALYYDADGTGAKAAVQFAQLDAGLKMTYKNFLVFDFSMI